MKADFFAPVRILSTAALAAVLATLLGACAGPEVVPHETPPPPVTSVAEADAQLASVARERAAIEASYIDRQRVCYTKFFVNRCLDDAAETHRIALGAQRAIEVQANHFKREALVQERDRNVAEAERRFQEQEAKLAAQPPKPTPQVTPTPPPRPSSVPQRTAEHDARARAAQQKEAADAGKRAQNVRDYEARKAESEARVRKVAQTKAEKAAKAAKEAEDAKAKAAKDAADATKAQR